jgi:predicted nucleotidyltransferase
VGARRLQDRKAIRSSLKPTAAVALIVPIVALGVPNADTLLAMARRAMRGAPLFQADKITSTTATPNAWKGASPNRQCYPRLRKGSVAVRITIEDLRRRRPVLLATAARWGAHHLRVFGSVARESSGDASDVDVIARFDADRSLLDLGGLKADLEEILGCPVDVLSEAGLRPDFRAAIFREAIEL